MATAGPPRTWMVGALITALILGVTACDRCITLEAVCVRLCDWVCVHIGSCVAQGLCGGDGIGRRIQELSTFLVLLPQLSPRPGALTLPPFLNRPASPGFVHSPGPRGRRKFFRIRLGHHSLSPVYESGQQMFQGIKTIPHPGYSHPGHSNDLMLIKLNRRIRETQYVKPINISSRCPSAGTRCLVSGWGTTSSPSIKFPKVLQCLNITVLSIDRCKEAYPRQIDSTMFCAGDKAGRDSCQGDSGGPLVCNGSLQGLVSFGQVQCGQPYVPSVYTNLCKFTDWIQKTIQDN
ncbi:kallikrein-5-like isoform 1 [Lynx pardinus]|uniref:Kallikrein-5-like isoform 1 n=1 Tax=Lynx pardinus TaxID=191816 RepID=A0A485NIT3_LYNPA|nr:kallikrein-5-like isoform 1 [Lynx pardinus]